MINPYVANGFPEGAIIMNMIVREYENAVRAKGCMDFTMLFFVGNKQWFGICNVYRLDPYIGRDEFGKPESFLGHRIIRVFEESYFKAVVE